MRPGMAGGGAVGSIRALLRCPACARPLESRHSELACIECDLGFGVDDVAIDLALDDAPRSSLGARVMQSSFLARIYESLWRPLSFGLSTGFSMPARDVEVALVVRALADAPGPWLDVSCGPGGVSHQIAKRAPRRDIVSVDLSRAMLARAKSSNPDSIHIRADAARLPFVDDAFGAVLNLAAFDLYPDPARVMNEIGRILAPGGRLVASGFLSSDKLLGSRSLREALTATAGIHPVNERGLRSLIENAGLTHIDIQSFGRYVIVSGEKSANRKAS